ARAPARLGLWLGSDGLGLRLGLGLVDAAFPAPRAVGILRRKAEWHSGLPLDQLDDVGEIAFTEPGADGRDERLRDLRRRRRRYAVLARHLAQQAGILGRQRQGELRRSSTLVDSLHHAVGEDVAGTAGADDLDHGADVNAGLARHGQTFE